MSSPSSSASILLLKSPLEVFVKFVVSRFDVSSSFRVN